MEYVDKFISSYSSHSFQKIQFCPQNDSHGKFLDINSEFRRKVGERLINGQCIGTGEILRDIMLEESKFSEATWGATNLLSEIAALLLIQTGSQYLKAFFEAKERTFDTDCALNGNIVEVAVIQGIINELSDGNLKSSDFYIDYFQDYVPSVKKLSNYQQKANEKILEKYNNSKIKVAKPWWRRVFKT
ncbi:hypothetical protein JF50_11320 [Pseudoalteromonas luteoviolacea]|uniref:Uncharacterized protein n=1 Tax=Pseudoalteromonas luteoviolacea TaxID=43657 RepID=A0A0C1QN85_9GAMM|nr:hypothetical protein [Pseudoalteromonas luteoviolacea]KID56527.1 hypothetical protein JF50_11320 [Pseudoalteromonas luteoviolacea]